MRGRVLFALLLALSVGATPGIGAADPALVAYLRTHPTDKRAVVARLKTALAAKDDASAYMAGWYLKQRLAVKSPKLDDVLGECARRLNRPDRARGYFTAALALNPQDARARAGIAALDRGPTTSTPVASPQAVEGHGPTGPAGAGDSVPASGAGAAGTPGNDPDYDDALRYFYQDRYERAAGSLKKVLQANPHHVAARLLLVRILMAQQDFGDASKILVGVEQDAPNNVEALVRMGEVLGEEKQMKLAEDSFKKALALAPKDPLASMDYATILYISDPDRKNEADALYAQAAAQKPFQDRELILEDVGLRIIQGQTKDLLDDVRQYQRKYGDDSNSLAMEGTLLFKQGKKAEAAESLEQAVRLNPLNLVNAFTIVPLLVTAGYPQRALAAVDALDAQFPGQPRIQALRQQVEIRVVTDRDMQVAKESPFEYSYPRMLTKERGNPVDVIKKYFKIAQTSEVKLMGFRPSKVVVKIHYLTGIDNPAFYSLDDDDITISGVFFVAHKSTENLPLTVEQIGDFARHMVLHEYAHMAFAHAVGYDEFKAAKTTIPIWFLEGIAEWAAGGDESLPQTAGELAALFKNGYLDEPHMVRAIAVLNFNKTKTDNLKAYVQSFYIVKYLMKRKGDVKTGIETFLAFSQGLIHGATLDQQLQKSYGLTHDQFTQGWHAQIKDDLIDASIPRLASIDPPAAGEGPSHKGIEVK